MKKFDTHTIDAVKESLYKYATILDKEEITETDYEVGVIKTAKAFKGLSLVAKNIKDVNDEAE